MVAITSISTSELPGMPPAAAIAPRLKKLSRFGWFIQAPVRRLENELPAQLDLAHVSGGADAPERRCGERASRVPVVDSVERVEDLGPDLKLRVAAERDV